jgi:hypothetical protein
MKILVTFLALFCLLVNLAGQIPLTHNPLTYAVYEGGINFDEAQAEVVASNKFQGEGRSLTVPLEDGTVSAESVKFANWLATSYSQNTYGVATTSGIWAKGTSPTDDGVGFYGPTFEDKKWLRINPRQFSEVGTNNLSNGRCYAEFKFDITEFKDELEDPVYEFFDDVRFFLKFRALLRDEFIQTPNVGPKLEVQYSTSSSFTTFQNGVFDVSNVIQNISQPGFYADIEPILHFDVDKSALLGSSDYLYIRFEVVPNYSVVEMTTLGRNDPNDTDDVYIQYIQINACAVGFCHDSPLPLVDAFFYIDTVAVVDKTSEAFSPGGVYSGTNDFLHEVKLEISADIEFTTYYRARIRAFVNNTPTAWYWLQTGEFTECAVGENSWDDVLMNCYNLFNKHYSGSWGEDLDARFLKLYDPYYDQNAYHQTGWIDYNGYYDKQLQVELWDFWVVWNEPGDDPVLWKSDLFCATSDEVVLEGPYNEVELPDDDNTLSQPHDLCENLRPDNQLELRALHFFDDEDSLITIYGNGGGEPMISTVGSDHLQILDSIGQIVGMYGGLKGEPFDLKLKDLPSGMYLVTNGFKSVKVSISR